MTSFVEIYRCAGREYGIEDLEAPGYHLVAGCPEKRFRCWYGIGVCGGHDTIEKARVHIREYAMTELTSEIVKLQLRLSECQDVIDALENNAMSQYKLEHRIAVDYQRMRAGLCTCGAQGYICRQCNRAMCEKMAPSKGLLCPECSEKASKVEEVKK